MLAFILAATTGVFEQTADGLRARVFASNACGAIAISAAGRLFGMERAAEQAFALLPPTGTERSFGELAEAAATMGLNPCAIRRIRDRAITLPKEACAVVKLRTRGDDGSGGHFVLLTGTCGDYLQILNLPDSPTWVARQEFDQNSDPLLLILSRKPIENRSDFFVADPRLLAGGLAWVVAGLLLFPCRQWKRWHLFAAATLASGIGAAFLFPRVESSRHTTPTVAIIEPNSLHEVIESSDDEPQVVFRISNKGGQRAHILSLSAKCACASAVVDRNVIEPGEMATLRVGVRLGSLVERRTIVDVELDGQAIPNVLHLRITARRRTTQ